MIFALCGLEAYTPVDNISELTARTNDEGWETVFAAWLRTSKAGTNDAVFVLSVGGGDLERNVSANIVRGLDEARARRMKIFGVAGRDGGYTMKVGDAVVLVPTVEPSRITPHAEAPVDRLALSRLASRAAENRNQVVKCNSESRDPSTA